MIGASKILTVSYGTFSCTLEGFEEPFSTMKAIAEYFRDLAADDRYFGAEPPTPDAEMLHRIAEREIKRRVEAKINENGVVLRAHELAAPAPVPVSAPIDSLAAVVAVQPVAGTVAEPVAGVAFESVAGAPVAVVEPAEAVAGTAEIAAEPDDPGADLPAAAGIEPGSVAAVKPEPKADAFAGEDSVVAKLSRLRAAAALARAEPVVAIRPAAVAAAPVSVGIYAEDMYVDDLYAPPEPAGIQPQSAVATPVYTAAETTIGAAIAGTDDAADDAADDATLAPADPALMAEAQNEPVASTIPDAVADAWAAYDHPAGDSQQAVSDFLSQSEDDYLDLTQLGTGADTIGEPETTAAEQIQADAVAAALPEALEALADPDGLSADFNVSALLDHLDMSGSVADADSADPVPETGGPAATADLDKDHPAQTGRPDLAADGAFTLEVSRRPRARVIKVRRVDYVPAADAADPAAESETAAGGRAAASLAEAAAHDPILANLAATMGDSGLSRADQADLLMELADVTREFATPAETDAAGATDDPADPGFMAETPDAAPMAANSDRQSEDLIAAALADQPSEEVSGEAMLPDAPLVVPDAMPAAVPEAAAVPDIAADAAMQTPALTADDTAEDLPEPRISEGRAILETETEPREDAISRLFEQTDSELQGTENRRRLSAIAHLKAAVAATEADKEARSDGTESPAVPSELDRYRDDLAQAVRPRRPGVAVQPTRRPVMTADRPAPLVLVSEQRIDRPANAEPSMIRPRRVTSGSLAISDEDFDDEDWDDDSEEAILSDSRSFAEFAERIGASGLSDLLEAAAAYAAYVEGRPSFSRPQIMKKIAGFSADDVFSREDGLRSFGMLLRQGKIQKVRRGQFAIAKTSRFIPEARRMAP